MLECLARSERPVGALAISRSTHLSTLVVIPILARLTDESLVRREQIATGSGRTDVTWAYALTGRGARAVAGGASRRVG